MQIKLFTIPILGGESLMEEMNAFLRSKKILKVESQMVSDEQGAFWCFCVRYLLGSLPTNRANPLTRKKEKVDYKEALDAAAFDRFSEMRVRELVINKIPTLTRTFSI